MYGDMVLVYDTERKVFFAGWKKQDKSFSELAPTPIWSDTVADARKTRLLGRMQSIAKMLGDNMRVVSETRAKQIELLKWYNEKSGPWEGKNGGSY